MLHFALMLHFASIVTFCGVTRDLTGNFSQTVCSKRVVREVKRHVYVKRQTRMCTTWLSFLFTCRLLFIISTLKLVVSRTFFIHIRIVFCCFHLIIFYFETFSTWIWYSRHVREKHSSNPTRSRRRMRNSWETVYRKNKRASNQQIWV